MPTKSNNCVVTHKDHSEGIQDIRHRRASFYEHLWRCLNQKEEEEDDQ